LYTLPEAHLVVTGRGRELIETQPEVLRDIHAYRMRAIAQASGNRALSAQAPEYSRKHLASGGNSDVFTVNDKLVMKEAANTQSVAYALERMDTLCDVMEGENGVPRWIDIPSHYGMLSSPKLSKQYLLMQKIDAGLTVEHVLSGRASTTVQNELLAERFGTLTDLGREELQHRFADAGRILTNSLVGCDLDPAQYMPDWHEGNVLVEPLRVPVGRSPFKFWVIDQ
jgi:hypothetical protein